ncbi:MAG: hypothetical protein C5S41_01975, partial [Candidatus Methanomarinus sp.]
MVIGIIRRYEPIGYSKDPVPMLKFILQDPKSVPVIQDDILARYYKMTKINYNKKKLQNHLNFVNMNIKLLLLL